MPKKRIPKTKRSMTQPDGIVNEFTTRTHYYNNNDCSATYSGIVPYLWLNSETGLCEPSDWRIYPASMEFGSYFDNYTSDAYSHSCNSAVNLYLPGTGSRRLHCIVTLTICRWIRDGTMGDELSDCVLASPPFYIGGMQADSAGRISFDTVDGTQWDISPTLAPLNQGYFDYDVDFTVEEL